MVTNQKQQFSFFNRNFREQVRSKIQDLCSDGSTITYGKLTEALGFSKDEESVVRELVQRELMGTEEGDVELVRGRNGGLGLVGLDHSVGAKYELDAKFIEAVRRKIHATLETVPRGVSVGLIAGLMGELDTAKVSAAIGQLEDFELVRGVGVRRKATEEEAAEEPEKVVVQPKEKEEAPSKPTKKGKKAA